MCYNLQYVTSNNREELEKKISGNCYRTLSLGFKTYNKAYIIPPTNSFSKFVPGGMLSKDGKIIPNTMLYETVSQGWENVVNLESAVVRNESVVFIGFFEQTWGHLITDSLKKLWFIKTEECRKLQENGVKLVAIVAWHTKTMEKLLV